MMWYIFILLVWFILWKGIALWHAARRGEKVWFAILMVVNTIGILEIAYLLFVVRLFHKKNNVSFESPHEHRKK